MALHLKIKSCMKPCYKMYSKPVASLGIFQCKCFKFFVHFSEKKTNKQTRILKRLYSTTCYSQQTDGLTHRLKWVRMKKDQKRKRVFISWDWPIPSLLRSEICNEEREKTPPQKHYYWHYKSLRAYNCISKEKITYECHACSNKQKTKQGCP